MGKTHGKLNQRMPWFCWMPWKDPWEIIINQWPESQNKCLHINPTCVWIAWAVCDCIYHTCSQYCNSLFFFRVDIVDHTGPFGGAMCAQLVSNQMVWFSCWELNFCNRPWQTEVWPTCICRMLVADFSRSVYTKCIVKHWVVGWPDMFIAFVFTKCFCKMCCETWVCTTACWYRNCYHKVYTPNWWPGKWVWSIDFCRRFSQSVYTKCIWNHMVILQFMFFLRIVNTKCIANEVFVRPHAHVCAKCIALYVHWYWKFESVLWKSRSPTCSLFDWPEGLWRCSMLSNFGVLIHKGLCIHSKVSNKKVRALHQL